MRKFTARELLRIAERNRLPIRLNDGHAIVSMPQGGICVMPHASRHKAQQLDDQIRMFRRAGLLPVSGKLK